MDRQKFREDVRALFEQQPGLQNSVPPAPITTSSRIEHPVDLFAPIKQRVIDLTFRLRCPAARPDGLIGPLRSDGSCLDPLLPAASETLAWFDPTVPAADGDLVLVLWNEDFLASEVETMRSDPAWIAEYGENPGVLGCKVLRHIEGRYAILANQSAEWLGRNRVLGVMRYVLIGGEPAYGSGAQLPFSAMDLSGSGFTASLKIKELVGTTTTHTDSTVSTPSSPSGLDHSINKSQAAEAFDDNYTFEFDVTINNGDEPGFVVVGIYTHDGGGWVQRGSRPFFGSTGEPTTVRSGQRVTVTVTGMVDDTDFAINIEAGNGSLTFVGVTYKTATPPATETATPAGSSDVQYLVVGG